MVPVCPCPWCGPCVLLQIFLPVASFCRVTPKHIHFTASPCPKPGRRGAPGGPCAPTALPTPSHWDPRRRQRGPVPRPPRTPSASPTFQQLPELLLLLGDLVQEELGVEVPDFGRRQAATCTVLGPVGDRGRRGEVRDRTHTGEGLDPPQAPSQTPSKAKSLPLGGSRDLPPSTTRTLPQWLRAASASPALLHLHPTTFPFPPKHALPLCLPVH